MKRRTRLIASVLVGLLACVLTVGYGASLKAEAEQERQELLAAYGGDLVSVCVAARDIDAGETLDEANVRTEEWVAGLLPADAVTSFDEVAGKRATSAIPEHAVLCPVYTEVRSGSLEIPDDAVAVSVSVDAAHAVGGSVQPGTDVDVYVSANGVADPLCQAQVIDTSATESGATAADLSWATLAVEPERVEELLAAMARGTVFLVAPGADVAAHQAEESGEGGDAAADDDDAGDAKADEDAKKAADQKDDQKADADGAASKQGGEDRSQAARWLRGGGAR